MTRPRSDAARKLERAGLQRDAAEAVATAIRDGHGELASKADIETLRADMGVLRADMNALEGRMTAKLYRALWLQAAGIIGAIAALASLTGGP